MAEYAGLGSRIVAIIVDNIILTIIAWVLALPFGGATLFSMRTGVNPMAALSGAFIAFGTISIIIWLLYFTYFEGTSGQTLGKKIVNIKVTKETGEQLTFVDAFIRTILRVIDMLPTLYIVGIILVLLTEKKQRLGDIAAHTIVVKA